MIIELQRVHYIPEILRSGILYVSEEFYTAVHLCPCGCGSKVRTPLGPTEWALDVVDGKPSLQPSIGNWILPCQSHYWIRNGKIVWAGKWTAEQVEAGRQYENERRRNYYDSINKRNLWSFIGIWKWIRRIFKK